MSKDHFYKAITRMRSAIRFRQTCDQHKSLDEIVETYAKGEDMEETTLENDVARIIKRIKEAKENEKIKEKANELIKKLKAEL